MQTHRRGQTAANIVSGIEEDGARPGRSVRKETDATGEKFPESPDPVSQTPKLALSLPFIVSRRPIDAKR